MKEKIKQWWSKVPPRYKNYVFWFGLAGIICNAMNITPETITSWERLWISFRVLISNPFQLACVIFAICGVWANPNTPGLKDYSAKHLKQ